MAETEEIKMQNIDISDFNNVQSIDDGDYVVLSLFNGTAAKVSVSLMKAVFTAVISPNIKDEYWYIGDKNLNVKAIGQTPEMRKGSLGIEYKYTTEDDTHWRMLIPYTDIKLQYDSLSDTQKSEVFTNVYNQTKTEILEPVNKAVDEMKKSTSEAIKKMQNDTTDAIDATSKATEDSVKAANNANKAAEAANKYANRVKDVTSEQWEEIETNQTWEEGVEYNVYEQV